MAKAKSISALIEELQEENERLTSLYKSFNKMVQTEFGYGVKELHQIIEKWKALERQKAIAKGSEFQSLQRQD